jgi:hypothetical protein
MSPEPPDPVATRTRRRMATVTGATLVVAASLATPAALGMFNRDGGPSADMHVTHGATTTARPVSGAPGGSGIQGPTCVPVGRRVHYSLPGGGPTQPGTTITWSNGTLGASAWYVFGAPGGASVVVTIESAPPTTTTTGIGVTLGTALTARKLPILVVGPHTSC